MSLETYTGYIPALVDTNPTPNDPKSEGDDHLRGIKNTLSTTFAGFTEPAVGITVTASEINSVVNAGGFLPGMVQVFAMLIAPPGWIACHGTAQPRVFYADLFAAIGTTYGVGDGSTTFNVPDLRGYFVRGFSNGTAIDPGRVFGTTQAPDNAPHTHTVDLTGGSHTHTAQTAGVHQHGLIAATVGTVVTESGGSRPEPVTSTLVTNAAGEHTHVIDASTHTHTGTTGSEGVEARPINVTMLYCIKT
jgi:microcystin-dependent protein